MGVENNKKSLWLYTTNQLRNFFQKLFSWLRWIFKQLFSWRRWIFNRLLLLGNCVLLLFFLATPLFFGFNSAGNLEFNNPFTGKANSAAPVGFIKYVNMFMDITAYTAITVFLVLILKHICKAVRRQEYIAQNDQFFKAFLCSSDNAGKHKEKFIQKMMRTYFNEEND